MQKTESGENKRKFDKQKPDKIFEHALIFFQNIYCEISINFTFYQFFSKNIFAFQLMTDEEVASL